MEEKKAGQRLTLEEMFDIFEQDVYKEYREEHGIEILHSEQVPRYIKNYPEGWWIDGGDCPLILAYILAEQMNTAIYGNLDLNYGTRGTFTLHWDITLVSLWVHPLVWATEDICTKNCVLGYWAIPVFVPLPQEEAYKIVAAFIRIRVIDIFVDMRSLAIAKEDDYEHGLMKGMHQWNLLTADCMDVYQKAFMGEDITDDDYKAIKLFSATQLRTSLILIANGRGGKCAAEILRLLQSEWPTLKLWKNALRNMTKEDIDEFEECLYHGFDDLLAEWEDEEEGETASDAPLSKPDSSFFGSKYSPDVCEKELLRILNGARSKAAACRGILTSAIAGYFILTDKTDQEKADAFNPWLAFSNKKDNPRFVFTEHDFCKANPAKHRR